MPTTPGGRPSQNSGGQPGRRVGRLRGFEQRPLRPVAPRRRHQAPEPDSGPPPELPLPTYGRTSSPLPSPSPEPSFEPSPEPSFEPPAPRVEPSAARQDTTTWITLRTPAKKPTPAVTGTPKARRDPAPAATPTSRDEDPDKTTVLPRVKPKRSEPAVGKRRAVRSGSLFTTRSWIAFAVVLAIGVPAALFLLRDDSEPASQSPAGAYADDKYRTEPTASARPSTKQSVAPTSALTKQPTQPPPSVPRSEPTTRPSQSPPPSATTAPTASATRPPTTAPSTAPSSSSTQPPTALPPPPASATAPTDSGGMSADEQQVFTMIDDARVEHGCARLGRDSALTQSARRHSKAQAERGGNSTGDGSEAIASADNPKDAYRKMMGLFARTLLNCDRTDLGVGYDKATVPLLCTPLGCVGEKTERRWSADFD